MRIGLDLAICGPERGGVGRYAASLAAALADLVRREDGGDPADDLLLFPGAGVPPEVLPAGVEAEGTACGDGAPGGRVRVETGFRRPPNRIARANLTLGPRLGVFGLDVFHCPDNLSLPLTAPRRLPLVATVHDLIPLRLPATVTARHRVIWNALLPRVVRRADRLIVPSEATAADLGRLFPAAGGRIRVVPEGVDPRFRPPGPDHVAAARARLGLPDTYLLWVGTIEPKKNVGRLLEAHALLRARRAAAPPLVLAGRAGWMADPVLEAARRQQESGGVILAGFLPDGDLPAVLGGAAAFLFPSLHEGFGLPVLEAMACGAPVIAADRGSLPEVCGDAALLVDPESPEALAEAMEALLDDPARRAALAARGLRRAADFTWEAAARRTLAVYREAAGR